ncbi:septal ring lytic transglycosylase RlpA family protein [Hyphobacterium sp. SN044]|uniref:septal ring lytic transglycosylase RlpA family protein n=1 Tax=Hyphobacterium sp. SN044 TaxID=2912575 RepID=UPI00235149D9|nr:septal ring lytic transglycosylase RlpA family protein [Hyphobacterium sp. SN044]
MPEPREASTPQRTTAVVRAAPSPSVTQPARPSGRIEPRVGNPYQINGRTYVPAFDDSYDRTGIASWYGPGFHGRLTASGEVFDENLMTAAHTTLPIPSLVEVTNLENGRTVVLRLNDRGPFADDRIIDLSRAAATELGFIGQGLAQVRVRYLGPVDGPGVSAPPVIFTASNTGDDPIAAQVLADMRANGETTQRLVTIQAGSFTDRDNAQALQARLEPRGDAWIEEAIVNGQTVFRVLLGQWENRAEAEMTRTALRTDGIFDARVVSLR